MTFDTLRRISLANRPVLKIAVMRDGSITADGISTSMEPLRALLKLHAEQNGVIWYYREAPQLKASPEAIEVVRSIAENRLPVRLSSRPDYSDSIGPDGNPIGTDGKPMSSPPSNKKQ